MTSRSDIDRILTIWLAEGATQAPHDRLRAALADVNSTPQKRVLRLPGGVFGGATGRERAAALAVVVLALVAVVGIGLSLRVGIVRLPTPTIPAQPESTDAAFPAEEFRDPGQMRNYRYSEAGFDISLPERWRRTSGADRTTMTATRFSTRLFIASGDEESMIRICEQPVASWEDCTPQPAADIEELNGAIAPKAASREEPYRTIGWSQTTLNGEPAVLLRIEAWEPGRGGQWITYVAAMHHGRPFVIRLHSTSGPINDVPTIVSRFHFVNATAAFSPSDPDLSLVWYEDRDAGFRVQLPREWFEHAKAAPGLSPLGGQSIIFGEAEDAEILRIVIGDPSGADLPELEDALKTVPETPPFTVVRDYTFLGGEPATIVRPVHRNSGLGMYGVWHDVIAIHDGRPVLLRFDYWWKRGSFESESIMRTILESFEFLPPASGTGSDTP